MPKISILTITTRNLFLAEQAKWLKRQTFKDFEWIIVDDLCVDHSTVVKEAIGDDFRYLHIQPPVITPIFEPGKAENYGIVHCHGELVYFLADYIMPAENCLERHWEIHQQYPKSIISGLQIEVNFPPAQLEAHKSFGLTGEDPRMGFYHSGMFHLQKIDDSLFETDKFAAQNWWGGRNDSAPLETLLDCNGFDEDFDGGHGFHDDDLANRMMIHGATYLIDTKSIVYRFLHQRSNKEKTRSKEVQIELRDKKRLENWTKGNYRANPHRDLRKERE